jgi:hypothetical protein
VHLLGFQYTNHKDIYIFQTFEKTVTNQNCFHENVKNFAKRNQFTSFSRPTSNFRKRDRNVANISLLFLSGCETCILTIRDEHRLKVSTNSLQQSSSIWEKQARSQTCTTPNKNLQNISTYLCRSEVTSLKKIPWNQSMQTYKQSFDWQRAQTANDRHLIGSHVKNAIAFYLNA